MKTITNSNQWMRNAKTALPAPIPALALMLSLATACTNQELPGATDATTTTADTRTMTITATMADDGDSNTGGNNDGHPQTRVSHENDPNGGATPGVIVKWTKGDAFKLYPATGNAAEFEIKNDGDITSGGKTATFTGNPATGATGEANALYPATAALTLTGVTATKWADIALKMEGQKQTGDNSYDHLPAYDYMTAYVEDVNSLNNDNGNGNDLAFHHLAAMMTIKITGAPDGDTATNGTTDNSPELLTLTAGKAPDGTGTYGTFCRCIKADGKSITTITNSYKPSTSSINLTLEGITWDANGFTAHLMMLPTDLSGKTFTVSVRCKDGTTYQYTTPQIKKAYVAGMRYTATIDGSKWTKMTGESNVFSSTTTATKFAGSGRETDPYIIASAGELKYMVEQAINSTTEYGYGNYFRLTTDIEVKDGTNWTPIGAMTTTSLNYGFYGHFDGGGHTIYGTLTDNRDEDKKGYDDSYFGFFGRICNGSVRNLNIKATVTNTHAGSSEVHTGGLAGNINRVEISGCNIDGKIQGGTTTDGSKPSYTGGLIGSVNASSGKFSSTISNCTVSGEVTASATSAGYINYTGGVAGYISCNISYPITIQSCTNHATITGSSGGGTSSDSDTGGIAGLTSYANISHCTNHGQVTAQYTASGGNCYVGGLIGMMETNTNLSDSENQGAVTGGQVRTGDYVSCCGGLIGQTIASATATNCTNSGTVSGNTENTSIKNYTGGLVGRNYGTLHQCLNTAKAVVTGETSAGSCTGGLVGYNVNKGAVYNCCTNLANVNSATPNDGNRIGGYDNNEGSKVKDCDQGHTPRSGNK